MEGVGQGSRSFHRAFERLATLDETTAKADVTTAKSHETLAEARERDAKLQIAAGKADDLSQMAKNDVQRLSPFDLVLLAGQVQTGVGDGETNAYGVSKAVVDGLAAATERLEAANQAVVAAKAAYHAAVKDREAERETCAESVAGIARTVFANPAVTPTMVLELGLSPHSTSRTKVTPKTPPMLTATPAANGSVRLEWARSGNAKAVNFIIEARDGTGAWRFVAVTTCASATVEGFVPGVATWFRVTASKNGLVSAPSPVAAIYPAVSTVSSLRMAA